MTRYPWTTLVIFIIWISSSTLIVRGALPNPEIFYLYLMSVTILLAYIGFRNY